MFRGLTEQSDIIIISNRKGEGGKKKDSASPVPLGKAGGVSSGHMHYKEARITTDFQETTTGNRESLNR